MEWNNHELFFKLIQAGLWSDNESTALRNYEVTDEVEWDNVYHLAEEQSVLGVVLAGIERLKRANVDVNINPKLLLQWIGNVHLLEQRNKAMNVFIAELIETLRKQDVYAVLVKGQGIAQCYERPLWRASGDVDLLLSDGNYKKAKDVLLPIATSREQEYITFKHLGLLMNEGFLVELHGTLHSRLSKRVDNGIDVAQRSVFYGGNVRSWLNGNTLVFLPDPNDDVIFIFTHILHHYFIDGIGLRQICDWCRLLWTYKDSLNQELFESRIRGMGLMSEWKAFATLAVEYLGMPVEAMPLYEFQDSKVSDFKKKAEQIMKFVLESGNLRHNRRTAKGKVASAWNKTKNFIRHTRVFPLDSMKFFWHFLLDGIRLTMN